MGRNFGCSRPTDGFERGLSDYLRVYSGVAQLMSDYLKSSNEVDNLNGFGMKCTLETG